METYTDYGYLNLARNEKQKKRQRRSSFVNFLLHYALPFILINLVIFYAATAQPDFELLVNDPGDFASAEISIRIKSHFPKKEFKVLLDSEPVELTKDDSGAYTATLLRNGTLEVSLTNRNLMNKTVYESIDCIDDAPPIITEDDAAAGFVTMYIEDTQSGVDYESIYAVDGEGRRLTPALIDEGEGLVGFYYESIPLEVHVSDMIGQECIATFGAAEAAGEGASGEAPEDAGDAEESGSPDPGDGQDGDSTTIKIGD